MFESRSKASISLQ